MVSTDITWQSLRSEVYIRDRGICWICNTFVILEDYDLGHLIDRTNGGIDEITNLAVMHRHCNHIKPLHKTLEDALKWKLSLQIPRHIINTIENRKSSLEIQVNSHLKTDIKQVIINNSNNIQGQYKPINQNDSISEIDKWKNHFMTNEHNNTAITLTIEYFKTHPELLDGMVNHNRSAKIRELAKELQVDITVIRAALRIGGLVKTMRFVKDGSQYYDIVNNFDILKNKYDISLKTLNPWTLSRQLGITFWQSNIFLYLIGNKQLITQRNIKSIERRLKELNIQIPCNSKSISISQQQLL